MRLDLDFVVRSTGAVCAPGAVMDPAVQLSMVTVDSRQCKPGALFVCLPGENSDGHDFAPQAVQNGCTAILASRDPFDGAAPVPVLLPPDLMPGVEPALRRLAAAWRQAYARRHTGPRCAVVGITGTAGKTTVKDVLTTVMEQSGPVSRTLGNFNSNLGLPLSLLNASPDAACWIMEAGISEAGDMDKLGEVLRPDLALILNAGPGHIAGLGKGTAHHKAALLKYLQPGGLGLISADYPELVREARVVRPELVFFSSTGRQVVYRAAYVGRSGDTRGLYRLWLDGETVDAETPFNGAFGAENVIAVAAAAHTLGMDARQIAAGLAAAELPRQRFAQIKAGNWLVIDDSYNANPLSAARMLEAAAELAGNNPLVCVLGEMRELGSIAEEEHEKLGRLVAEKKARAVFWAGGFFTEVASGLSHAGFAGHVQTVDPADSETLLHGLRGLGLAGGTILFKGSRANRLERLVTPFVEQASAPELHHAV